MAPKNQRGSPERLSAKAIKKVRKPTAARSTAHRTGREPDRWGAEFLLFERGGRQRSRFIRRDPQREDGAGEVHEGSDAEDPAGAPEGQDGGGDGAANESRDGGDAGESRVRFDEVGVVSD